MTEKAGTTHSGCEAGKAPTYREAEELREMEKYMP
jgi:hypothetical protein